MDATTTIATVYAGDRLSDYNLGADHPFGPLRYISFVERFHQLGLERRCRIAQPAMATRTEIERFHTAAYIDRVTQASLTGSGYFDNGDTPAFAGVYEAAAHVVGTVLQAVAEGAASS